MIKIISGGQTGVDRAALDFAINNNIDCGGWCPKSRIAENGIIPDKYPLKETESPDYSERTELNVKDSDGTLIFFVKELYRGTALTKKLCKKYNRPYFLYDLLINPSVETVRKWINDNNIQVINIAGPRESSEEGIYNFVYRILTELFVK